MTKNFDGQFVSDQNLSSAAGFFRRVMADEFPEPGGIDGSELFDKNPGSDPGYLDCVTCKTPPVMPIRVPVSL